MRHANLAASCIASYSSVGQRHRFHFGFDGLGLVAPGALEVKHELQIPVAAAVAQLPLAFIGI